MDNKSDGQRKQLKQEKQEKWQALSDEWKQSDLTQLKFCELKNIKLKTFINQRQKVLQKSKNTQEKQKQFLPAHVNVGTIHAPVTPSVILKLPNGIGLHIASNSDKTFIKNIFELLGITSC